MYAGRGVRLRAWQRREIRRIYDNPHKTRRAILSFGRKNGKTALAAFLLLVHLCGPEALRNTQLYSAAMSRDQAGIVFGYAMTIVRLSPTLSPHVGVRETAKELYYRPLDTVYRALSADATTAFGLSPVFILHDELGQVRGPRHRLYEALETATAGQRSPLSIILSTQAASDTDLLSMLIDDAMSGADPTTICSLYTADPDMDPFSEEALKAANPALGDFQNADEVRSMAAAAQRMPTREAEYRNLILNQRVEAVSPFVSAEIWRLNGAKPDIADARVPIYLGLDLSSAQDLVAAISVMPLRGGNYGVDSQFWLPNDGLADRARTDGAPYDVWVKQGFINTTPGRTVEYEFIAKHVVAMIETQDVRMIAFDRWNIRHFKPWVLKAGLPESVYDELFVPFGQGYQSMSPALLTLESLLLTGKIQHGDNPVLKMCAANSVVVSDTAGNRKLDKKRSRGRIDGMVALTMAVDVAQSAVHDRRVFPVTADTIIESG